MKKLVLLLMLVFSISALNAQSGGGAITGDGEGCYYQNGQLIECVEDDCNWVAGHYETVTTVHIWFFNTPLIWSTEEVWVAGHCQ